MKNKYPHIFEPITVRRMTVKNRIVMTPMGTNYGEQNGEMSFLHINYYEQRAKGGTVIIRRSNEKLMCIEAVPDGIRVLILRFAGKRNINLTGVQIVEHHLACAIQDSDLDSRIILVERLKARNQIGLRDRIACADDEFTREQLARLRKLFFAALDEAQTVRNIVKEKLSLTGQDDTARAAREQPNLQLLFQLLDGLADCRL